MLMHIALQIEILLNVQQMLHTLKEKQEVKSGRPEN